MQNHKEVVEEDKRNKLPTNWESRKRQAEWIMQDEAARKEAEAKVWLIRFFIFDKLYKIIYLFNLFFRVKTTNEKNCWILMPLKQKE